MSRDSASSTQGKLNASSKKFIVAVFTVASIFGIIGIFEVSGYRQIITTVNFSQSLLAVAPNPNSITSSAESLEPARQSITLPTCSLQYLRQFAASHHDYPTIAFDVINKHSTNNQTLQLSTSASASCWFPAQFDTSHVTTAWTNRNIQRILILGDSNGVRYFNATLRILKRASWQCKIIKKEFRNTTLTYPDAAYFVREPFVKLEHIRVQTRDCASCLSVQALCSTTTKLDAETRSVYNAKEVWIEYIGVEYTIDSEITTHRTHWTNSCLLMNECEQSTSTQEFIFKEYLQGQYPDVVFFFASCHDIVRFKMRHLRHNFDYLFGLMDIYLPLNTTGIFMNVHKQIPSRMPKIWREARYEYGTLNSNEALLRQNRIMYQALEKYLLLSDRLWYAFPSLFDSSTATDNLYVDAVHRTDKWYDYVMNALLYILST